MDNSVMRKCPWCDSEIMMASYSKEEIFEDNVVWKNELVYVPVCVDGCGVKGLYVHIDAESGEEAWRIWNNG